MVSIRLRSPRGSYVKSACVIRLFLEAAVGQSPRRPADTATTCGYSCRFQTRGFTGMPRQFSAADTSHETEKRIATTANNGTTETYDFVNLYTLPSILIPVRKQSERRSRPSVIWTAPRRHVGQNNDTPFACQIESRQLHPVIAGDDLFVETGLSRCL